MCYPLLHGDYNYHLSNLRLNNKGNNYEIQAHSRPSLVGLYKCINFPFCPSSFWICTCFKWEISQKKISRGYTLRWLGTAGWKLDYQSKTILFDPFFSRKSIKDENGKDNFNQVWKSDPNLIESGLKKATINHVDTIFVSHSHFDHVGDVPYLLKKFPGATVYGSLTTCNILASTNPTAQCFVVSKKTLIELPGIRVRVIPSLHAVVGPQKKLWFPGILSSPSRVPLKISEYREGGSFMFYLKGKGLDFLFQGSANFIEKELKRLHPKIAVMAPIAYSNIENYQKRLIGKLRPRIIFLNHFDEYLLPYSAGIVPLDQKELAQFIAECSKNAKEFHTVAVITPQFFKEIVIQDNIPIETK